MSSAPSGWPKQFVDILGSKMAYVEFGTGDPIVFLHGNPTSSYLWRNIAPELSDLGRCVVPDLIGMGDSAKLSESGPNSYRFVDHRRFLDAFLENMHVADRVVFVVHDWGIGPRLRFCRPPPEAIRGIPYMEFSRDTDENE